MNLDFLILPQSFQKGVSDTNASATARKNDFSVKERDEVKTFKSKNSGQTEQDKSFDDFMQNLRKKSQEDSVQNKKSSEGNAEKTNISSETVIAKDLFLTRLAANLPVDESGLSTEDNMLDSIAALNAEIARLINLTTEEQTKIDDEQPEVIPEESSPELIAVANETIKTQDEIRNIFALFANLVEQTENTGGGNDAEISAILDKIKGLVEAEDGSLITSGYTPEQLTELQKLMQDLVREQVSRRDLKMLEALAAQWVTLAPPPVKKEQSEGLGLSKQPLQQQNDVQGLRPQEALPTPQDGNTVLPEKNHAQSRYDTRYDLQDQPLPDDASTQGGTDFKSALKNAEGKPAQETHSLGSNNNSPVPAQKFLQGIALQSDGLVTTTPETTSSLLPTQGGVGHTSLTTQNILTNVAAHAPQAGQPHPATQAVVATIQRAVKEGEDTSIKLRLDPPELGRVEVKMSIGKDNVTKIVLTAEKPETYMMLQRDAQVLERALQDSGLNADSGLSFELAGQNHDFNGHDNRRGGGHDRGGTGAGGNTIDNETIETVMNWKIDPRTGQMHYNVLV